MIEYKYPEEKEVLLFYASKMKANRVEEILQRGRVLDKDDAKILSVFYWSMLDLMAEDKGLGVGVLEQDGFECWAEYIFHTLNGYLVSNGYEEEWDSEE